MDEKKMTPAEMMEMGISIWADGKTSLEPQEPYPQRTRRPRKNPAQMTDEELDAIDPNWRQFGWDVRKWGFIDPQH
ncbi:MAG: hypothetical protein DRJ03_13125 [Chloroflexi bacterium]|nr:MAG: hypothetical protein DRJ03_13125 [Chloroflexota bacterium]